MVQNLSNVCGSGARAAARAGRTANRPGIAVTKSRCQHGAQDRDAAPRTALHGEVALFIAVELFIAEEQEEVEVQLLEQEEVEVQSTW